MPLRAVAGRAPPQPRPPGHRGSTRGSPAPARLPSGRTYAPVRSPPEHTRQLVGEDHRPLVATTTCPTSVPHLEAWMRDDRLRDASNSWPRSRSSPGSLRGVPLKGAGRHQQTLGCGGGAASAGDAADRAVGDGGWRDRSNTDLEPGRVALGPELYAPRDCQHIDECDPSPVLIARASRGTGRAGLPSGTATRSRKPWPGTRTRTWVP